MGERLRVLAVDVGTGTQDILLFESDRAIENCFQLVMPSPTVVVAERIRAATAAGRPVYERIGCHINTPIPFFQLASS